jgi:type II secretory pathway pseudopilin PulG
MTPNPMNAPVAAKPAAMPLIALILGVTGFCFPPFFLVAVVLAIVSLVKSAEPAYAARKVLAIITLALTVIYVPIVGILAAIAIPNFMKFQARSKQAECKSNLRQAYTAQKAYFADKDQYGTTAQQIGFDPFKPSRYLYVIGEGSSIEPSMSQTSNADLVAGIPAELREAIGVQGTCPDSCTLTMACAANLDTDPTLDVWSVSSEPRIIKGEQVPAGIPRNEVNDVAE